MVCYYVMFIWLLILLESQVFRAERNLWASVLEVVEKGTGSINRLHQCFSSKQVQITRFNGRYKTVFSNGTSIKPKIGHE